MEFEELLKFYDLIGFKTYDEIAGGIDKFLEKYKITKEVRFRVMEGQHIIRDIDSPLWDCLTLKGRRGSFEIPELFAEKGFRSLGVVSIDRLAEVLNSEDVRNPSDIRLQKVQVGRYSFSFK